MTGNQFYVTHCTTADSALNDPGYSVRAASTRAELLDAAFRFPPYELPIEMWKDLPAVEGAPRRLARVEDRAGIWAVHSSYLAKDTVERDRSYFSHLVLLPSAGPLDVLRSWGASGWVKSYPPGATKVLGRVAKLPIGKLVNDAAVTAFLGDAPGGPTDLCVTVCPARLRANKQERRALFARFLSALLLRASEGRGSRPRLYVHAEPGLVALLLYSAVRLLPPSVTENLTFSTFEPHHRNIRGYKLADVVGTYLGATDKGLDADFGTTRGIAFDTFDGACSSPALRGNVWDSLPAGVPDLIELAAAGEWKLLPAVKHAVGAGASGLPKAGQALALARLKEAGASKPTPTAPSGARAAVPPPRAQPTKPNVFRPPVPEGRGVGASVRSAPTPSTSPPLPATTARPLPLACPKCGNRNIVPPNSGGRSFLCSQCKVRVVVPQPHEVHHPAPGDGGFSIACRCGCGLGFRVPKDLAYAWAACPGCSVVAVARPA